MTRLDIGNVRRPWRLFSLGISVFHYRFPVAVCLDETWMLAPVRKIIRNRDAQNDLTDFIQGHV